MKNIEKTLGRRDFLRGASRTAGGIILLGGISNLLGCESVDYDFNLSGLEEWQKNLFIKAGAYWGKAIAEDINSGNYAYLGITPLDPDTERRYTAYTYIDQDVRYEDGSLNQKEFTVIFNKDLRWVDCDIEGKWGADFYNVALHEIGHLVGKEHSKKPGNIMYNPAPQRC